MMTTRLSLLFLFSVAVAVQGQTTNGTGLDFTGSGYLSCNFTEWEENNGCASVGLDPSCPSILSCTMNISAVIPTLDSTGTIIYIPLFCECSVALDCPSSCTKSDGSPPEPTPVSATSNFTGIGIVTCPFVDFYTVLGQSVGQCIPRFRNDDVSTCGSCDVSNLDPISEPGDEFVNIPLLCDCLQLFGCPDSCIFNAGSGSPVAIGSNITTQSPTSAPRNDTVVTAPPATDGNGSNTTSPPAVSPVGANVTASAPTANGSNPMAAPVRSPVMTSNTTSAAFAWRCNSITVVIVLLGSIVLSG